MIYNKNNNNDNNSLITYKASRFYLTYVIINSLDSCKPHVKKFSGKSGFYFVFLEGYKKKTKRNKTVSVNLISFTPPQFRNYRTKTSPFLVLTQMVGAFWYLYFLPF